LSKNYIFVLINNQIKTVELMPENQKPKFHRAVGEFISAKEADMMHKKYFERKHVKEETDATKSVFFGIDKVMELLKKEKTEGLRIYFIENSEGKMTTVLTAADANGRPISPNAAALKDAPDEGSYLDNGALCPKNCP
jgi:hypothetical protein